MTLPFDITRCLGEGSSGRVSRVQQRRKQLAGMRA